MHELIHQLLAEQETPCVTVTMPVAEGAAGLHAVLDDVESRLDAYGMSARARKQYTASARTFADRDLPALTGERSFVLFLSPSSFHAITLQDELVLRVTVGRHYHWTPLFSSHFRTMHYYILAASKHRVRLFEVDENTVEERSVEGLPASIDEAWEGMERQEKSLQFHGKGSNAVFHGQGGGKDVQEQEEDRFMHTIAKAIHPVLHDQRDPLVFAGVQEAYGMLKKFDTSGKMLEEYIQGNPDQMSGDDLRAKADAIVHAWTMQRNAQVLEEYGNLSGTGRTSTDPAAILSAAHNGKVDLLILAEGGQVWGSFDAGAGEAAVHDAQEDGDEEFCGLATASTLQHHGRVVMVSPDKMPDGAVMAAVLRY